MTRSSFNNLLFFLLFSALLGGAASLVWIGLIDRPVAGYAGCDTVLIRGQASSIEIHADVAARHSERRRGLMGRQSLAFDTGMLFVFPADGEHAFWMKGTSVALDMVFIDVDGARYPRRCDAL